MDKFNMRKNKSLIHKNFVNKSDKDHNLLKVNSSNTLEHYIECERPNKDKFSTFSNKNQVLKTSKILKNINNFKNFQINLNKKNPLKNSYLDGITSLFQQFIDKKDNIKKNIMTQEKSDSINSEKGFRSDNSANKSKETRFYLKTNKEIHNINNNKGIHIKNYYSQIFKKTDNSIRTLSSLNENLCEEKSDIKDRNTVIPRQISSHKSNLLKFFENNLILKKSQENIDSVESNTHRPYNNSLDIKRKKDNSLNCSTKQSILINKKSTSKNIDKKESNQLFKEKSEFKDFKNLDKSSRLKIKELYVQKALNLGKKNLIKKHVSYPKKNIDTIDNNKLEVDQNNALNFGFENLNIVQKGENSNFKNKISNISEIPTENNQDQNDIYQIVKKIDFSNIQVKDDNIFKSKNDIEKKITHLVDFFFSPNEENNKNNLTHTSKTQSTQDTSHKKQVSHISKKSVVNNFFQK